jgi:hypothetical protein
MLHPNQFHVNEAWIVFKLNDAPICTDLDGDFNCIVLMDAASCFILSSEFVPTNSVEPSKIEAKRLLKAGRAHKQQWPKTLFVPNDLPASVLSVEAKRHGIAVVQVPEDQLLVFIGEAREGFRERLGRRGTQ